LADEAKFRGLKIADTITATYIMLTNWTDQGIRGIKDSPNRLDAAKKVLTVSAA
jgi:uncharacterized protein with GYD domain